MENQSQPFSEISLEKKGVLNEPQYQKTTIRLQNEHCKLQIKKNPKQECKLRKREIL